jgi:hypothetical protein
LKDNGYLDNKEIESIIEQMMNVAKYQQWDTIELEPVGKCNFLQKMNAVKDSTTNDERN